MTDLNIEFRRSICDDKDFELIEKWGSKMELHPERMVDWATEWSDEYRDCSFSNFTSYWAEKCARIYKETTGVNFDMPVVYPSDGLAKFDRLYASNITSQNKITSTYREFLRGVKRRNYTKDKSLYEIIKEETEKRSREGALKE